MEFASGGDLSTCLGRFEGNFEEIRIVLAQMISGLQVLHERGIFHGDLKLENVLLTLPEGRIKLADFGLSSLTGKASHGTPDYMAPEQLKGFKSVASDCWSLGICAWELATGLPPFYSDDPNVILNSISQADWRRDLAPRAPGTKHFQALLKGLLQPNPKDRLTITAVKKHEFFTEINWKQLPLLPLPLPELKQETNPFDTRNERFTAFKPYNLKVLETEKIISAQQHLEEGNKNGMFPSEELFEAASQLFPICNLYA